MKYELILEKVSEYKAIRAIIFSIDETNCKLIVDIAEAEDVDELSDFVENFSEPLLVRDSENNLSEPEYISNLEAAIIRYL